MMMMDGVKMMATKFVRYSTPKDEDPPRDHVFGLTQPAASKIREPKSDFMRHNGNDAPLQFQPGEASHLCL